MYISCVTIACLNQSSANQIENKQKNKIKNCTSKTEVKMAVIQQVDVAQFFFRPYSYLSIFGFCC